MVFKLDPTGNETVLHSFLDKADGGFPVGGLIRDAHGNIYGTTVAGGNLADCSSAGCGVVFRLSSLAKDTLLYTFSGGADGGAAFSGLLPYKGYLYGTAASGGNTAGSCSSSGCGVVFKLSPP